MRLAALVLLLVACRPAPTLVRPPAPPRPTAPPAAPEVSWVRIATLDALPDAPPARGSWRVHLIDVGTGLAILV